MDQEKTTTKDVLKVLAVGGIVLTAIVVPGAPMAFNVAFKAWKNYNRRDVGKIIKRLGKQRMVSFKEDAGRTRIELTEKGKHRLLEYDFENLKLKTKKVDGKWRLVIFDIPENKKVSRDAFRKKMLELGFIRLQDSVFASAFPCRDEIDFLCHYLGISDFVTLTVLDRIERGEKLLFKKHYIPE